MTPEVEIFGRGFAETAPVVDAIVRLHGGRVTKARVHAPTIVTLDMLGQLGAGELEQLRLGAREAPLFVVARSDGAIGEAALHGFSVLTGVTLHPLPPALSRRYRFAQDDGLDPFAGLTLTEHDARYVAAVEGAADIRVLMSNDVGAVLLRAGEADVLLSLVPLPDYVAPLKREFRAERFAAVLPLMLFARSALGKAAWQLPKPRASFLVDDPNLRFARYGRMDLREVAAAAGELGFHLGIAMIPLDYRKTSRFVGALVTRHREHVSLVMHGVDHLRCEFEADVPARAAASTLATGIARMDEHRRLTGLDFARVMTFPHGACNATWLAAMRDVGFDAVLVSRALPFLPEERMDDPLYELHPAEMSFRGLPIVNRFKAEEPLEQLLFQSWLGKPLVVYFHHAFFAGGLERLVETAAFIDRRIAPQWASVASIVESNYQLREGRLGTDVRVFSNRVRLPLAVASQLRTVVKPGRDIPADEHAQLSGEPVELRWDPELGVVATVEPQSRAVEITFGPACPVDLPDRITPALKSRARRLLTEARDQALGRVL
jgi:hypothetical protein